MTPKNLLILGMAFEVHSLMQDADHFNPIGYGANEQHVSGGGIFSISDAEVIAGASPYPDHWPPFAWRDERTYALIVVQHDRSAFR